MKRKLLATLLCASMAIATLAGCGGETASTTTDAPAAEEAKTEEAAPAASEEAAPATESNLEGEIHYAYWHGAMTPYLEECKANFEAANPGVTLVLEETSWDEYWTKLETAASGGAIADVFHLNGPNIGKYAEGSFCCLSRLHGERKNAFFLFAEDKLLKM